MCHLAMNLLQGFFQVSLESNMLGRCCAVSGRVTAPLDRHRPWEVGQSTKLGDFPPLSFTQTFVTTPPSGAEHQLECHGTPLCGAYFGRYWSGCLLRAKDFPVAQTAKNLPAMQETRVQSLGQEDPLEKEMATHSSILA